MTHTQDGGEDTEGEDPSSAAKMKSLQDEESRGGGNPRKSWLKTPDFSSETMQDGRKWKERNLLTRSVLCLMKIPLANEGGTDSFPDTQ